MIFVFIPIDFRHAMNAAAKMWNCSIRMWLNVCVFSALEKTVAFWIAIGTSARLKLNRLGFNCVLSTLIALVDGVRSQQAKHPANQPNNLGEKLESDGDNKQAKQIVLSHARYALLPSIFHFVHSVPPESFRGWKKRDTKNRVGSRKACCTHA